MRASDTTLVARFAPAWAIILIVLAGCVPIPPKPEAEVNTPAEGVTVTRSGSPIVVDVYSETGIGTGEAALPRRATAAVIRIHLRGLEDLRFRYPGVEVMVSVNSSDGAIRESASVGGGPAQELGADSPYWMPLRVVSADPSIPLKNGYFELDTPSDFWTAGQLAFQLSWIDFYR
jgi:hypothetical protein